MRRCPPLLAALPAAWLAAGAVACAEPPPPRPLSSFGQPMPTASTTAEPLWLRSGPPPAASAPPAASTGPSGH
ncbi:MAG TPA: hypothetical protein VFS00_35245 [Polyangiaceae bacterium]|nr:hypothetical protein [Polyangiaceae bacterium]